jgi:hypothetical protein
MCEKRVAHHINGAKNKKQKRVVQKTKLERMIGSRQQRKHRNRNRAIQEPRIELDQEAKENT